MPGTDASGPREDIQDQTLASRSGQHAIDVKDTQEMADDQQTRTEPADPAETERSGATRKVLIELLTQHQALLTELRWAYGQLERVQEVDIAALKQRVSELEQRGPAAKSVSTASATAASKMRKRVEFTLQHPDRAVRVAGRRLAGPLGQAARRAGFNR